MSQQSPPKYEKIPGDIKNFFIKKIKEEYVFKNIIGDFLFKSPYLPEQEKYIEWCKTNQTDDPFEIGLRINKIVEIIAKNHWELWLKHDYDYDDNVVEWDATTNRSIRQRFNEVNDVNDNHGFLVHVKSDIPDDTSFFIKRYGSILSGFKLSKYDIGTRFAIEVGGRNIWEFELTKENRNELILPMQGKLPLFLGSLPYHGVRLICLSKPDTGGDRTLDRPVRVYYTSLSNHLNQGLLNGGFGGQIGGNNFRYFAGMLGWW